MTRLPTADEVLRDCRRAPSEHADLAERKEALRSERREIVNDAELRCAAIDRELGDVNARLAEMAVDGGPDGVDVDDMLEPTAEDDARAE